MLQFGVSPAPGYSAIPEVVGGYRLGDKVYPFELFLFSAISALLMFVPTYFVYKKNRQFRLEKLKEIHAVDEDAQDVQAQQQQ